MAVEHRAPVALSIAFIASIVAYPNFAPDIFEPTLVAFLLPITAAVIWWLRGRLRGSAVRDAPGSPSCADRTGPATVLFLSAFHVTMLIALIGAHLWLGRILGS